MSVYLVQPFIEDFYITSIRLQPLGLFYLKAVLEEAGIETVLIDALSHKKKRTIPIPDKIKYLGKIYSEADYSPGALFYQYYHFGLTEDEIINRIDDEKCEMVGISANFTGYLENALRICKAIKNKNPQTPIIVGGAAVASLNDENLISIFNTIDYVCYSEGEQTIVKLYDFLMKKKGAIKDIPNLIYKEGNRLVKTENKMIPSLDSIPIPARGPFMENVYKIKGKRVVSVICSRGCPYNCAFCSIHSVWKKKWRKRSVYSIVDEIDGIVKDCDPGVVNFEDDNLCYDSSWFKSLLRALIWKFRDKDIEFAAMNGVNYHQLDNEILGLLYKAGFRRINLSVTSLLWKDMINWGRPSERKEFYHVIDLLKGFDFLTTVYFIIGAPGQDWKGNLQTICELAALPVMLGGSVYYLTPGQRLADSYGMDYPSDWELYRSTSLYSMDTNFTSLQKYTLLKLTRMINYIKSHEEDQIDENWISTIFKRKVLWGMDKKGRLFPMPTDENILEEFFKLIKNKGIRKTNHEKYYF